MMFLIDCGRMMTNEAAGLSLLDHALNCDADAELRGAAAGGFGGPGLLFR